jgi:hypothetical protein
VSAEFVAPPSPDWLNQALCSVGSKLHCNGVGLQTRSSIATLKEEEEEEAASSSSSLYASSATVAKSNAAIVGCQLVINKKHGRTGALRRKGKGRGGDRSGLGTGVALGCAVQQDQARTQRLRELGFGARLEWAWWRGRDTFRA